MHISQTLSIVSIYINNWHEINVIFFNNTKVPPGMNDNITSQCTYKIKRHSVTSTKSNHQLRNKSGLLEFLVLKFILGSNRFSSSFTRLFHGNSAPLRFARNGTKYRVLKFLIINELCAYIINLQYLQGN